MSNILTGRARVVYVGEDFVHLSKGGVDGKIVAFKDAWLANSYVLQDWVSFKAKPYDAEPPHSNFGVRFKALPKSVKFEAKAVMTEDTGTFFKVDEHQGQYGFITTKDGSTVYFTASVVRPETQDIRNALKTGTLVKFKAIEQKQNNCRWRAIAVCNKNASFDSFSSRQQRPTESSAGKQTAAVPLRKTTQISGNAGSSTTKHSGSSDTSRNTQALLRSAANMSQNPTGIQLNNGNRPVNPTADSRSSSISRSEASGTIGSSRIPSTPLLTTNALSPSAVFAESSGTGDAYEDAVRRLAYFRHLVVECSCQSCILR